MPSPLNTHSKDEVHDSDWVEIAGRVPAPTRRVAQLPVVLRKENEPKYVVLDNKPDTKTLTPFTLPGPPKCPLKEPCLNSGVLRVE